jgi:hypothetical protein
MGNENAWPTVEPITEHDVSVAQNTWCEALVTIGQVYSDGGNHHAVASRLIDELYDYKNGTVFFKPTLAFGANAFRSTKEGTLSYFIGGNPSFPDDTGFALKRWVNVRYDNSAAENGIQIHGDIAITMGNFYLTEIEGKEVMVEKTLVFRRCNDSKLRLCAHKSALPFDAAK